jgi:hypothetical protein
MMERLDWIRGVEKMNVDGFISHIVEIPRFCLENALGITRDDRRGVV